MDNQSKKRLFIALNIPKQVKQELIKVIEKLQVKNRGVKWVKADGLHLTLHFLGSLDENLTEQVKLSMQSFQGKFNQLQFQLGKINAFPNLTRPRVIFIECKQVDSKSVFKLQELLCEKLIKLGIGVDRRSWKPHLTLGRVKVPGDFRISSVLSFKLGTSFSIDSFELMQSTLNPGGAEYKEVISCKL